ncbi:peptidylprolyl isomerase [Saccharomycopsis crataegensis]|uniref:Serine/threonine-protein phosphatase 2A activator n=1 Tax=Saccharomycopsis crataegensis TaxID=43959 RepID=A0AAV5QG71_9ASCO|nr:peptidylprolyl isomerase [Saccharomycopsis crataegensis]
MGYITPVRRILTAPDLEKWKESPTYDSVVSFIETLAEAVKGKTNDAECEVSLPVSQVLLVLDDVEKSIDKFPVIQDKNTSRFGKVEFRDFYDEITQISKGLLSSRIPKLQLHNDGKTDNDENNEHCNNEHCNHDNDDDDDDPLTEICVYFNESWGNRTRIDYGSGHELNFMCFLLCLVKLHVLDLEKDATAIILKIFIKYMKIMRNLQQKYWLEPAGSHGVWGLDDYHFLPFLFGASQLSTHPHLKPKSIHNKEYVDMFKDKYLYFHCIWFINSVKTASLRWHSPMLDDISGVRTWSKVAEGMIKMYKAEVLNKLPIIQHFFFGKILPAPEGVSRPPSSTTTTATTAHTHNGETVVDPDSNEGLPGHVHTWGDCCGIKLPSAIAAHQLEAASKPIPFD